MIRAYTIKSNSKKNEEYSVILSFIGDKIIQEKSSCSCKHGSFYRFTQKNISLGKWKCKHIEEAIRRYENNEPDNIEIERRENEKRKKQ